jgi:hypothetical protein
MFCSVRPEPNAGRSNCFSLMRANAPPMILQALTPWDMDQWMTVIQNSIFMALHCEDGISEPAQASAIVTADVCADCGSPNASWLSINWALSICEDCAGEHRGLGAQVSKVRSRALDDLDPSVDALVAAVGRHANEVLEYGLQRDEKLRPDAAPADRAQFLTMKYRKRAWVAPADDIDFIAAIQAQDIEKVYKCVATGKLTKTKPLMFGPIHAAAIVGNTIIMQLLCLNSIRVDMPDDAGWSPLCYAAFYGQEVIIDILFASGAETQNEGVSPCLVARQRGNELISAKLSNVNAGGIQPDSSEEAPHPEMRPAAFHIKHWRIDSVIHRRTSDGRGEASQYDRSGVDLGDVHAQAKTSVRVAKTEPDDEEAHA